MLNLEKYLNEDSPVVAVGDGEGEPFRHFSLHKSCSDAFGTDTRVSVSVRVLQKLAVVIFASGVQFLETLVPVQESGYRYEPLENTILAL
ncbi:hypothetical protein GQ457_18G016710 [Hibiscus cannabinus]